MRVAKRILGVLVIWAFFTVLVALSVPVHTSVPTHLLTAALATLLIATVVLSFVVVVAYCFDVRL